MRNPPLRNSVAAWVARVLAGVLGLFALVVGAHDALRVSVLADRLTGTAFALGGGVLIAAAVASRAPKKRSAPAAGATEQELEEAKKVKQDDDRRVVLGLAAGFVGVGIGGFMLLAVLEDSEAHAPRWMVPWVLVMVAGIAIASVYIALGRCGRIADGARGSLRLLASGVAATVLVGLVQLWHESASKASHSNPNVVLETTVTPIERPGRLRAFEVEFRARNMSDVAVVVVGSRYRATGVWLDPLPPSERSDEAFGDRLRAAAATSVNRTAALRDSELLQGGPLIPENQVLFADQEYVTRRVVVSEPGRYDRLDVEGFAYVARKDRLSVKIPTVPESEPRRLGTGVLAEDALQARVERLPIREKSLIARMTTPGRELLRVRVVNVEGDEENLVAYVDVRGHDGTRPPSKVDADASIERYGLTLAQGSTEVYVGPSRQPPTPAPRWQAIDASQVKRLKREFGGAQIDGRISFAGGSWVLGHTAEKGVFVGHAAGGGRRKGDWRDGHRCPDGVPDAVMGLMQVRDPQSDICSVPLVEQWGLYEIEAVLALEERWPKPAGPPVPILSPWTAAVLLHPGDARARNDTQDYLDERGMVAGLCAERKVSVVPVRSCRLGFRSESAEARRLTAEHLASSWRAIRENLLVEVREVTSPRLGRRVMLATTSAGTEATIAYASGGEAILVVAGPSEPDDAQRTAERVAGAFITSDARPS